MIPLYGFLAGDTLGLLILAEEDDTMAELATKLQQAAFVRVATRDEVQVRRRRGQAHRSTHRPSRRATSPPSIASTWRTPRDELRQSHLPRRALVRRDARAGLVRGGRQIVVVHTSRAASPRSRTSVRTSASRSAKGRSKARSSPAALTVGPTTCRTGRGGEPGGRATHRIATRVDGDDLLVDPNSGEAAGS